MHEASSLSALFSSAPPTLVSVVGVGLACVGVGLFCFHSRLRRRVLLALERRLPRRASFDIKEAEEARSRAEAASEAKSRLLATMSHEIRTPLNGILGMAELLVSTGLDLEQQSYVEAMRASGLALAALIDEILDFSKIEAGKFELTQRPLRSRQPRRRRSSSCWRRKRKAQGSKLRVPSRPALPRASSATQRGCGRF